MTVVDFYLKGNNIVGFKFEGHANYSVDKDIVCSAISSHVLNTIDALIKISNLIEDNEIFVDLNDDKENDEITLEVKLNVNDESKNYDSQIILRVLLLSMKNIYKEYKENVALYIKEVH